MSYAKSLQNTLKDKNETIYGRLKPIEEIAKAILPYTAAKFPYYTPHFFLHSQNVEENLNWLIPDDIKSKMNEYELFFIIIAAWFHDWGMVASERENEEEVRKLHHIRTEENFEKFYDKLHLSQSEARIIGRICKGHREEDLLGPEYRNQFLGSNISIRISFLASLLRIADECDVTANRTPEIIYYNLRPEGASEEAFKKHLLIQGIGQPDHYPYKIVLNCVAYSPKGVQVIEGVKKQIQKQLDSVKTILASNLVVLDIIETQIETRGFINKPIGFELDRKMIVNLLIGRSLYSRDDVVIRELLQNSVDTCRFRKVIESSYKPLIEIEFNKESITFKDNGIGMSFEDAFDFFSKKGSSFYTSKNFKDVLRGRDFDPISKFGIGVLSCFMIANKLIVNTKKENCSPSRFCIMDLAEGWTYVEGAKRNSGTEITIILDEKGKKLDIIDSLKHYAKEIEIPISIKNIETGESEVLRQNWDYDTPEIVAIIDKDIKTGFDHSKPRIQYSAELPDLEIKFYLFDDVRFESNNCFVLNHGIYIGNFNLFPAHSNKWVALINLKSNLVDLTVSREDFTQNEKYKNFLSVLGDSLNYVTSRYVDDHYSSDSEIQKSIKLSSHLNPFFFDSFGVKSEDMRSIIPPRLIAQRNYPVLTKEGLGTKSLDDAISNQPSKVFHYILPILYFNENIDLITKNFRPILKNDEVIIFDPGPHLQFIKTPRKFVCSFCETVKSKGINSIEHHHLATFLSHQEYSIEHTALDSLLPPGSYFSRMQQDLKGLVVEIKPFEFSVSLDNMCPSDSIKWSNYHDLVAKELFFEDPELVDYFNKQLGDEKKNIKLSSPGYFVYDAGDQFMAFLISKADLISSNSTLKKLCERYLRLLAIYYLSHTARYYRLETVPIVILEKTLAEMLDYSGKYIDFRERAGRLSVIYNHD
ncbi:MAG: ATP-binding protein [Methanomicrobiales archaeon]|jgi:hypothetical protein